MSNSDTLGRPSAPFNSSGELVDRLSRSLLLDDHVRLERLQEDESVVATRNPPRMDLFPGRRPLIGVGRTTERMEPIHNGLMSHLDLNGPQTICTSPEAPLAVNDAGDVTEHCRIVRKRHGCSPIDMSFGLPSVASAQERVDVGGMSVELCRQGVERFSFIRAPENLIAGSPCKSRRFHNNESTWRAE